MQKFQEIVFIQGEEAEEPLNILDSEGESAALQYLAQWDYGENDGEIYDEIPAGSVDSTYREDDYMRLSPRLDNILLKDWCKSL